MNDAYAMNTPVNDLPDSENRGVQLPVCGRTLTTELSGDFSLPDYQPEIKRLLRIGVSVLPPERYVSGDSLELEGNLDYFVLYMGNDNQLYCAPLSTDYRMNLSLTEERSRLSGTASPLDGELICTCDISADPVTGRVTAPRRLNIKNRLKASVRVYGTSPLSDSSPSEPAYTSVERLTETVTAARMFRGVGEMLALQDDMILSPGEGSEMRVVCAEGQVMVSETSPGRDMVTCRGDVLLKLTLCPAETADGEPALPTVNVRKIPFSQAIPLIGMTPDCKCMARGSCAEMSVEVEEGHLHTDLGIVLEVTGQRNEVTPYTKDLYSTRRETSPTYTTYDLHRALACFNGNFTLSDSMPLTDAGINPSARVLDATATAFPEAVTADPEKNRCVLSGRCRVHLLMLRDGEYISQELELPFRYEKDGCISSEDIDIAPVFEGSAEVLNCRVRMDGERIGIDAEVAVALRLMAESKVKALTTVAYGDEITHRRGEYVLCFPAADDTLWAVAKKYHAPMAALSAANGLPVPETADSKTSLEGIEYLIV